MTRCQEYSLRFLESCHRPDTYPENVLRTQKFEHTLKTYNDRLLEVGRFWEPSEKRPIAIWDLIQNENEFRSPVDIKSDDLVQLQQTITSQAEDAQCRFIFLQTTNSRGPLCCTRDQFFHIFTHHQVMPSAMDLFLELRPREKPISTAVFRHEDYLGASGAQYSLEHLRRSGYCIQHAFSILGYEHETHSNEDPWPLRHIVVYHYFDIKSGTSIWILVKGNMVMRKRIMKSSAAYLAKHGKVSTAVEASFIASLRTHLLLLEWCSENLSQYIDSLDERSHKFEARVKVSPVARMAGEIPNTKAPSRQPTWDLDGSRSRKQTGLSHTSRTNQRSTFGRAFSSLSRMASGFSSHNSPPNMISGDNDELDLQTLEPTKVKDVQLEDIFTFNDLQSLHNLADEVDKANTILDQNKKLLSELRENYKTNTDSPDFRSYLDYSLCASEISDFLQQVRGLEADLDSHQCRLRTLLRSLEKDESLFTGILQYQSMRTGEFFSESAQKSAITMEQLTKKMGIIAVQTKHETVSMHVITGLTLVFLPGTFVAVRHDVPSFHILVSSLLTKRQTFFSSDIVDFQKGKGTDNIGDWGVSIPALKLFLAMCIPLMAITLSIWLLFYIRTKRQNSAAAILDARETTEKIIDTGEV